METKAILQTQAMRFLRPIGSYGYMPETVKLIREQFRFVGVPKDEELLTPAPPSGIVFRHGTFQTSGRSIIIDMLQIFAAAVLVTIHSSSDDADAFLDDLIQWAGRTFNIQYQKLNEPAYNSQLEVKLAKPLSEYFPKMKKVCEAASLFVPDFHKIKPPYEVAGITLSFDRLKIIPTPANVRLERRENAPYADNLYFSEGPFRTKDHEALLRLLEETLSGP